MLENKKNDQLRSFLDISAAALLLPSFYKLSRFVSPTTSFFFVCAYSGAYFMGPRKWNVALFQNKLNQFAVPYADKYGVKLDYQYIEEAK